MAVTTPVNTGYSIINGTTTGSNGSKVNTWIEWKETSTDVTNNTSVVDVYFYSQATASLSTEHDVTREFGYVAVDGTKRYKSLSGYSFKNKQRIEWAHSSFTVTHNADGTKSVTISAEWSDNNWSSYITSGSASATVTLTQIPRASTISNLSINVGASGNVTITRASSSFVHTLKWTVGGKTVTFATKTTSTTVSFTATTSTFLPKITGTSITGTLTCETYTSASALSPIGTSTSTLTITIPKASISNVSATMGSSKTISITKLSDSSIYTAITYNFGNLSNQSFYSRGNATSATNTFPVTLAQQIPNATSGTGTITIATYHYINSTYVPIGSTSYTLTLTVPSSVVPTVTLTISKVYTGTTTQQSVLNQWNQWLQGYTKVTASLTSSGAQGSTIKSSAISGSGINATGTSSSLSATSSGTIGTSALTYTGTVTDSRGRTGTNSKSLTPIVYNVPTVNNLVVQRYDNTEGTVSDEGTALQISFTGVFSPVANLNKAYFYLQYKETSASSWTTVSTALASYTTTGKTYTGTYTGYTFDTQKNYNVRIRIVDGATVSNTWTVFNESFSATINIPSAERILNVNPSGSGLAIGGFSTDAGKLQVYYPADFEGSTLPTINGGMFVKEAGGYNLWNSTRLPETCDLNEILTAGIYYTNTGAGYTISNLPPLATRLGAFNLKVERMLNTNSPSVDNNWKGVFQTFTHFDGSIYHRVIFRGASNASADWSITRWMHLNEGVGAFNTSSAYITDANNMTISGSYWVGSAYVSNLPVGAGWFGVLTTENPTANLYKQTFTTYNNGRTWVRTYANRQWFDWFEITHGSAFTTLCTWGNYYTIGTKVTLNSPFTNYNSLIFRLGQNEASGGTLVQQIDTYFLRAITTASSSTGYIGYNWYDGTTPTWVTFKFNSETEVEITGHGGTNNGLRSVYGIN